MDFKLIGCILLIVGSSIGAGMLALPIATASIGFIGSVLQLIVCWLIMTLGAFLILEVNLWLPTNSNIISMAGATIGPIGQILAWIIYLLLLYSLLCAYIAGGSDLFHSILHASGVFISPRISAFIFTLILGSVVYLGIRTVDYVNRGLMSVKFLAFFILAILLIPFITLNNLTSGQLKHITSSTALTVTITSFGYATIVPSLRIYFAGNIRKLKTAIFIGSLIPLICYIIWDAVIMGIIPLDGSHSLMSILQSKNQTSNLLNTLNSTIQRETVTVAAKLFTSICMVTSFLGVALCVSDFLADGLQMEKKGAGNILIHLLTFLPPLIVVIFFPHVFIKALEYAGIYCVILLILLPAWMAWHGRYHRHLAKGQFTIRGGKPLLAFLLVFSVVLIARSLIS